jgi:hypothetical protein
MADERKSDAEAGQRPETSPVKAERHLRPSVKEATAWYAFAKRAGWEGDVGGLFVRLAIGLRKAIEGNL